MSVLRQASVFVRDRYAGILQETDTGYLFQYDPVYLRSDHPCAVSLTIPLQEKPFQSNTLFPFFDGLIPEGWLLDVVTRNWKIDPSDRFGLLQVACGDCVGNVSVREVQP